MILLSSGTLDVEILEPHTGYLGSRFSHVGFIAQVHKNGLSYLGRELTYKSGLHGFGLCNEFDISFPPRFSETAPGEWFGKIGVGLLRRLDEGYNFMYPYEQRLDKVNWSSTANSASFACHTDIGGGFSYRHQKEISLEGNRILVDYLLENTGTVPLVTEEYAHNFINLSCASVADTHRIRLSRPEDVTELPPNFTRDADGALLIHAPQTRAYYTAFATSGAPYSFTVERADGSAALTESVDFAPSRAAIWGEKHVVSVELFRTVSLAPGEAERYRRSYTIR